MRNLSVHSGDCFGHAVDGYILKKHPGKPTWLTSIVSHLHPHASMESGRSLEFKFGFEFAGVYAHSEGWECRRGGGRWTSHAGLPQGHVGIGMSTVEVWPQTHKPLNPYPTLRPTSPILSPSPALMFHIPYSNPTSELNPVRSGRHHLNIQSRSGCDTTRSSRPSQYLVARAVQTQSVEVGIHTYIHREK